MFNLLKKRQQKQKEKALEWYKEWQEKHPEAVQELREQEQKIKWIKENNIPLTNFTSTELRDLIMKCPFPENALHEEISSILEQRRNTLGMLYKQAYSETGQELYREALEHFTEYRELAERWEEHIPVNVFELSAVATYELENDLDCALAFYDDAIAYYEHRNTDWLEQVKTDRYYFERNRKK